MTAAIVTLAYFAIGTAAFPEFYRRWHRYNREQWPSLGYGNEDRLAGAFFCAFASLAWPLVVAFMLARGPMLRFLRSMEGERDEVRR